MPELPEVETVRGGLAPVLEGHRLARVEARRPDLRFPLPANFVQVLTGARQRLENETGTAVVAPVHFHAFSDLEDNVRRQIERVRSHPWIPQQIPVRGFVYDVKTGKLREVQRSAGAVAA